jgi:hypothetical protein
MTRSTLLQPVFSGAITMGYCICALFFLRFWRSTRDRLFAMFSAAFLVLGLQRLSLMLIDPLPEWSAGLYLIRLLAFLLILAAILDKNRARGLRSAASDGPTS